MRGEQEATTSRLSRCFLIMSLMCCWLVSEQVYRLASAWQTLGILAAFPATRSTSMTEAMLWPQWQMNTPTRGDSSVMSRSQGYSWRWIRVPRAGASWSMAHAAAAEACATDSGMSLGSWNAPAT